MGWVLLILGAMHFFNLAVFSKMRKRAITEGPGVPPLVSATPAWK